MSYAIIRNAKYKMANMQSISRHNERKNEKYGNKDIDTSKTELNYHLKEPTLKSYEKEFAKIKEEQGLRGNLRLTGKKQSNVVCEFLITSDKEFFEGLGEEKSREFFENAYVFAKEKCGEEHIISSVIHMDEATPHMHLTYIPTVEGKDRKGNTCRRVNCSEFWKGFNSYGKLQDDFYRHCKEQGYNLERGEIREDKREHLSVEEYKLATKEKDLQAKKNELEKLEKIDTKAELKADKGKIAYSTKEVDLIKNQNKSLKVEVSKKEIEMDGLKKELENVQKRLVSVQNELKGTNIPLEHLKDLESENRALEEYVKANEGIEKELKPFQSLKEQSYFLGQRLCDLKLQYADLKEKRKQSIDTTYEFDKKIKGCNSSISDLKNRQKDINLVRTHYKGFEKELEGTKGLFKGKQRQALQENMETAQGKMQKDFDYLKENYGIEPSDIEKKINDLHQEEQRQLVNKKEQSNITSQYESSMKGTVKEYKYIKALSETQSDNFKDISSRLNARAKLSPGEEKKFYITKEDRKNIIERVTKENPRVLDRCKALFEQQDARTKERYRAPKKNIDKER